MRSTGGAVLAHQVNENRHVNHAAAHLTTEDEMAKFSDQLWFEVETCCNCGMAFAMVTEFRRKCLNNHNISFFCPAGHGQHYTGQNEAQRLQRELERERELLASSKAHTEKVKGDLSRITKAHKRMRVRVANGVCPCCNRSFTNLRDHMKTQHAEFGKDKTLSTLRKAFGMTQADVANEVGVSVAYVSNYERDKPVPRYAEMAISEWVERTSQ